MEFYKNLSDKKIKCLVCARYCEIDNNSVGYCGVRKNENGNFKLLTYGKILFLKKKGLKMCVGGVGSNMRVSFDPNWDTSLYPFLRSKEVGRAKTSNEIQNLGYEYSPEELIKYAKLQRCKEIVFQFNEPIVNIEYIIDICKKSDIKISIFTTGYFSQESLDTLPKHLYEITILFFSTFDKFYIKHCNAYLSIIKKNIKYLFDLDVNLKIFVPLIPDETDVLSVVKFLNAISPSISLRFVKFLPSYRMLDKRVTTTAELKNAVKIANREGMENVDFIE